MPFWIPIRSWKLPSSEEVSVLRFLYTAFVVCLFGIGVYILYLSFGQPPEKAELAAKARWIGPCLMVAAVAMKPSWVVHAINWTVSTICRR
jgi:hypothetical protein